MVNFRTHYSIKTTFQQVLQPLSHPLQPLHIPSASGHCLRILSVCMFPPSFVILAVFLSTFTCIYFMSDFFSRGTSRGHRICCPAHHLEQTDKTPFNGLIRPGQMTTNRASKLGGKMLPSRSVIYRKHLNRILYI